MKRDRLILLILFAFLALAGLILLIMLRLRQAQVSFADDLPVPPLAVRSPVVAIPTHREEAGQPTLAPALPGGDDNETARILKRMQALADAAEPVLSDDDTDVSTASVVTPEEGLRKMAESIGMPLDDRPTKPYSRDDFMHDSVPVVSPEP